MSSIGIPSRSGRSRKELFTALGVVSEGPRVEEWTEKAYHDLERKRWKAALQRAPHGRPWHTSFHGSSFPGGLDDLRCARKALYTMMDPVPHAPDEGPWLGVAGIGAAVEEQVVYRWGHAGITIGGSVAIHEGDPAKQLGFEHDPTWLTGSLDAVMDLRPDWPYVLPVDVKSKNSSVIAEMKRGEREYDASHYAQVQSYIYLCREFHEEMGWDQLGLEPAAGGTIFYVAREQPRKTCEFYVPYDEEFVEAGVKRLKEWKSSFAFDRLPERPKEWRWTEEPCKWCDFKKHLCKPDIKSDVSTLTGSHLVEHSRQLRPDYDPVLIRAEVMKRWRR